LNFKVLAALFFMQVGKRWLFFMVDYLQVGKIINTHGIHGEVKVIPLTDDMTRYDYLDYVFYENDKGLQKLEIENVKYFKSLVIVKFKNFNNINEVESLKGKFLLINRDNAVKLDENSYFICDIIGCRVFDEKGTDLGIVEDVIQTGSNDVYAVKNSEGREILIPALKSVVKDVSIEEKRITVVLPKGLIDDEI